MQFSKCLRSQLLLRTTMICTSGKHIAKVTVVVNVIDQIINTSCVESFVEQ